MWHELAEFQLQVSILGHLSVGCQSVASRQVLMVGNHAKCQSLAAELKSICLNNSRKVHINTTATTATNCRSRNFELELGKLALRIRSVCRCGKLFGHCSCCSSNSNAHTQQLAGFKLPKDALYVCLAANQMYQ